MLQQQEPKFARDLARRSLAFLCAVVAATSAYTCYVEARPYFSGPASNANRLSELKVGPVAGFSLPSVRFVLDECAWGVTSLYGRLQSETVRADVVAKCTRTVQSITEARPGFAYGWYVRALMAEANGDKADMNAALATSRVTDPTGQWLAQLRVDLAEQHFSELDAGNLKGQTEDLALLVRSRSGISSIARRYVTDEGFRDRITAIVETLPPEDQRRFVDYVKSAAVAAAGNVG